MCEMMDQENSFLCLENESFQAVDLPYGGGDFSMIVFLPRPDKDVDWLISQLTEENWVQWLSEFSEKEGRLYLPKFKIEWGMSLNDVLGALGMGIAFDPCEADFRGMYEGVQNLYISSVIHKTYVDVNEAGTEAAAVTSVEIGITSVDPYLNMVVERPFVFVIKENQSNTILFMGRIVEPEYN
jgi:serine protease inhibitor